MRVFSKVLNELIEENGITKYKLAKDLNYNKTTVLNWCEDQNEPKVSQIAELSRYFDVSADYLIGLTEYEGKIIENPNQTPQLIPKKEKQIEILTLYNKLPKRQQAQLLGYARGLADGLAGFTL